MSLATYTFTSLVRRGFTPNATGEAPITVTVDGQPDIQRTVPMMTPADVTGIAAKQVIRSWPRDGVHNAEPNYLAIVEFDSPDVPWLFSRPDAGGRFHPWLMLVVIDVSELDEDPLQASPLGNQVTIPGEQRPDPTEAWLWAHAQLLGTDTVPDDPSRSLSRLVCPRRLEPDRQYLACVVPTFESGRRAGLGEVIADDDPLRLASTPGWQPAAGDLPVPVYHWFRFSTGLSGDFESLVRRLQGVPLPEGLGRRRLRLDHPLSNLPRAGIGDLELHVALRPPGAHTSAITGIGSYLDALKARLVDAGYDLTLLAKVPPRVGPPVYGQLPVGAEARAANLGKGVVPPWLDTLNADPRHRVAAGLGAEVVRRNQDHYVEEAWRQVGDVLAANRLRRRAEFSLAATRRLYTRWISRLDAGDLLTATSPVHAKVLAAPGETFVGRLRDSPVPPPVVSVELRRFARQRGELAHAVEWQQSAGVAAVAARSAEAEPLVQRLPLDSIESLEPPSKVWGAATAKEILDRLVSDADIATMDADAAAFQLDAVSKVDPFELPDREVVAGHVAAANVDLDRTMGAIGLLPTSALVDVAGPAPAPPVQPPPHHGPVGPFHPDEVLHVHHDVGGGLLGRDPIMRHGVEPLGVRGAAGRGLDLTPVLATTDVLETVEEHPALVTWVGDQVVLDTALLNDTARTGATATSLDGAVFDQIVAGTYQPAAPAVVDFQVPANRATGIRTELGDAIVGLADLVVRPGDAASKPGRALEGGLESLRAPLLAALDPTTTILRAVNSRISALRDGDKEALDDIMAAPELSEPTYNQLAAISHDWLLPGLDQLPTDRTTLVAANLEFIASFLVGMNHELARELLWREYPTDQRGTYARQFWTHRATGNPADQFDLRQLLHLAPSSSLPGLTQDAGAADPEDPLVLVVKGELVQRYPGLIIVAATTEANAEGDRVPKDTIPPDFVGLLEPDVMLVGFTSLKETEVRAADADPNTAWWFFFAEHFTEPRFGLDEIDASDPQPPVPASWNDACWSQAHLDDGFLGASSFSANLKKGVDPSKPPLTWGSTAAAQAWITLQFPFRRGMRARDLLPPETSP